MDNEKVESERELTSSMGSVLSTANKDDKNDASDSTPTSSTDANNFGKSLRIVPDDPISSTSSDLLETTKATIKEADNSLLQPNNDLNMLGERMNSSPIISDADLLDMNITDVASEKITEDVEDIVQDLENLLGESSSTYVSSKSSETTTEEEVLTLSDVMGESAPIKDEGRPKNAAEVKEVEKGGTDVTDDVGVVKDTKINENLPEKTELKNSADETATAGSIECLDDSKGGGEIALSKSEGIVAVDEESLIVKDDKCESELVENKPEIAEKIPDKIEDFVCEEKIEVVQEKQEVKQIVEEAVIVPEKQESEMEIKELAVPDEIIAPEQQETIQIQEQKLPEEIVVPENQPEIMDVEELKVPEETVVSAKQEILIVEEQKTPEAVLENQEEPAEGEVHTTPDEPVAEKQQETVKETEIQKISNEETVVPEKQEETADKEKVITEENVIDSKLIEPNLVVEESTESTEPIVTSVESSELIPVTSEPVEEVKIIDDSNLKREEKVVETIEEEKKEEELSTVECKSEILSTSKQEEQAQESEEVVEKIPVEIVSEIKESSTLDKAKELHKEAETVEIEKEKEPITEKVEIVETKDTVDLEPLKESVPIPVEEEPVVKKSAYVCGTETSNKLELLKPNESELSVNQKESETPLIEETPKAVDVDTQKEAKNDVDSEEVKINLEETLIQADKEIASDKNDVLVPVESGKEEELKDAVETEVEVKPMEVEEIPKVIVSKEKEIEKEMPTEEVPNEEVSQAEETPLVEEIVSEQPVVTQVELQENLETLLAVASVTNNLEQSSYAPANIPEEDLSDNKFLKSSVSIYETNAAVQGIIGLTGENDDDSAIILDEIVIEPDKIVDSVEEIPPVVSEPQSSTEENIKQNDSQIEERKAIDSPVVSEAQIASETNEIVPELAAENTEKTLQNLFPDNEVVSAELNNKTVAEAVILEKTVEPSRSKRAAKKVEEKKVKEQHETKKDSNKKLKETEDSSKKQKEVNVSEPLSITIDDVEKVKKPYSPKITIKPIKPPEEEESTEETKGSLKMTITKQSDTMHSILKVYNPDEDCLASQEAKHSNSEEQSVPKLIIKPVQQDQDLKISTRSTNQRSGSPRITIKKVVKPETVSPLKITLSKNKIEDGNNKQKHSPKLTIKPIIKPDEEIIKEEHHHSSKKGKTSKSEEQTNPKVTIKPIVKPPDEPEQVHSPRITIKPIPKPADCSPDTTVISPRLTIKPIPKHDDCIEEHIENNETVERSSPKITIKPVINPNESEGLIDSEDSLKERIVLKISKGSTPSTKESSRKREHPEDDKSEKLAKIKLKFPKEGGHPHIVQQISETNKRTAEDVEPERTKKIKQDLKMLDVTITPVNNSQTNSKDAVSDDNKPRFTDSPIIISEDSSSLTIVEDVKEVSTPIECNLESAAIKTIVPEVQAVVAPTPRKRGRPRKVPLEVREDFKEEQPPPAPVVLESSRPKRSCRGPSVRTTLGIKPRKPRGPGRGRGSKRGLGTRTEPMKPVKEPKLSAAKLKRLKESFLTQEASGSSSKGFQDFMRENNNSFDVDLKAPSTPSLATAGNTDITERSNTTDIVMFEEETRMSADTSSRAQTPAKQIVTVAPPDIDESQSSVQSSATTESVKERKKTSREVYVEPEGAVISADQLAEYYWGSAGPFMLQEQVAQFLAIKSFKRKYPNIPRRTVDMQERDFIRESGLANEAMCDLGLTAVNSADILDIMYSDFQDKYEEYCKHQRDRRAKELINKQKALSLAVSQERNKLDITEQAVHSAAAWNANFNKSRREQRTACMDLQTLTVHYPKGKVKQGVKEKVGSYPVAVVPGQFTDYYKEFTPTEINNFPLSTMCYNAIERLPPEEMEDDSSDDSGSDSDSSSSGSSSSDSDSSSAENCKICNKNSPKRVSVSNN